MATITDVDLRPRLGKIHLPTLVIYGGADPLIPVERGRVLAAGIPRARLIVLPPEEVKRALAEFLEPR